MTNPATMIGLRAGSAPGAQHTALARMRLLFALFCMRNRMITALVAAIAATSGCAAPHSGSEGYGLLTVVCDTLMKRPPRPAEIPDVPLAESYGAITGAVFRQGTEAGIDSASITLVSRENTSEHSSRSRLTGQSGGFAFDSISPGRYLLRVRAVWEHPESVFVVVLASRIDTVRIPLAAPGF